MTTNCMEFVGFDLGHGESAVALGMAGSNTEPGVLEVAGCTVLKTVVGVDSNGQVRIGEAALRDSKRAFLRFKSRDFSVTEIREPVQLFAKGVLDNLLEGDKIKGGDDTCIVVGCPSGWSPSDREAYKALLINAGLQNVRIIAESRAAFLHSRESQEIRLTDEELRGNVLIVDIGSSTTDLTAVSGFREFPIDFGDVDLGAGLIDETIFLELLEDQDDREALLKVFSDNQIYKLSCELRCRKAKEQYFNMEASGESDPFVPETYRLPGTKLMFIIDLSKDVMERVLSRRLAKLNGVTWKDAFEGYLTKSKNRLQKDNMRPDLVLMTGGPSRMKFARDTAKKLFDGSRVVSGIEPQYAIAKGLAWAGRLDHKVQKFLRKIADAEPEIRRIVDHRIEELYEPVVDLVVDSLSEIMLEQYCRWRDCSIETLRDVEDGGERKASAFFKGVEFERRLSVVVRDWLDKDVLKEIEHLTRAICEQHGIPSRALELTRGGSIEWKGGNQVSTTDMIGMDDVGGAVVWIVGIVSAVLAGGAGTALVMSGPIGWVIGLILGLIAGIIGWEAVTEWVKDKSLPCFSRKVFPGKDKMKEKMEGKKPELREGVLGSLEKAEVSDNIASEVTKGIVHQLKTAADSVILVIT